MMKYYLIDDDMAIIKTLENIIVKEKLGDVIGYNINPEKAITEIKTLKVDIVLIDLLMSEKDGISVVKELKAVTPNTRFIMISKVSDKEMVGDAYGAGVDFFINKPLNIIEIKRVLENTNNVINNENVLKNIEGILGAVGSMPVAETKPDSSNENNMKSIKHFLGNLGLVGEKGATDILNTCKYMIENQVEYNKETLQAVADLMDDTAKNVEQRIRRTIKKGLTNVAIIAIDDFGSEIVEFYGNYVYDFASLKEEMEFVKGNSQTGGRIKINRFIEGLLTYIE
ncbi:MAG: DNA-binding domain-containing protein [Anaerovoracaceae bacterium]